MRTHVSADDVAAQLGLRRHPRSWRGACPACSYASTFTVKVARDGAPRFFCASCGDLAAIRSAVAQRAGLPPVSPNEVRQEHDAAAQRKRKESALRCWRGALPAAATVAGTYLSSRGIGAAAISPSLRYRVDVSHPEHSGSWPAMVAAVTDAPGTVIAVHRTYLHPSGRKADATPGKATLGPCWGGAVRIGEPLPDPARPQLVIGEGIESTASAGLLMKLSGWAALSAGNLAAGLILPDHVRNIIIAADHDQPTRAGRRPGQEAADAAARRWRAEGRTVAIALPDRAGADFNDVLMEAGHA